MFYWFICVGSVTQLCPTLCDPMDCSPLCFFVHGILQARILAWIAMRFSRASSWPRDQTWVSNVSCSGRWVLYHSCYLGSLQVSIAPLRSSPRSLPFPYWGHPRSSARLWCGAMGPDRSLYWFWGAGCYNCRSEADALSSEIWVASGILI